MTKEYEPYVVKQGDYLTKLAYVRGADAKEIWDHEKNKDIQALRKSTDMLAPGDIVHLPVKPKVGLPFSPGTTNRYRAKVPVVEIHLVFANADDTPIANEPYELRGGGKPPTGQTDAEGRVSFEVPVTVREVTLDFPQRNACHVIRIGDLDPLEEGSGVRQRLAHLGLLSEDTLTGDGDAEAQTAEALRQFQVRKGLDGTGVLDDATRAALRDEHGV